MEEIIEKDYENINSDEWKFLLLVMLMIVQKCFLNVKVSFTFGCYDSNRKEKRSNPKVWISNMIHVLLIYLNKNI